MLYLENTVGVKPESSLSRFSNEAYNKWKSPEYSWDKTNFNGYKTFSFTDLGKESN